jgi:ACDE family multidrug resistance protein
MPGKKGNINLLRDTNLYMVFIVTLFAVMGVASIAPAFPQMIKYFSITKEETGWLIASFTLPGIFLAPFMGILSDRFGRKNILIPSLMLFGLAGFNCIFIHTFEVLLLFRFIQGIGAAAIGSLNVTLIGDLYEGKKRKEAMGYNASVLSLGTASYPAIGGALALAGWQYPFVLPVLAIPFGLFIAFRLKNPEPERMQDLMTYFRNTWKILKQRSVVGLFIINILVFFLLYGASLTYLPLLLEERVQANSLHIGLIMTLMSLVTALTSSQLIRINRILPDSLILPFAIAFYGLSMFFIVYSGSWIMIILPVILFGLGHGLFIPTVQTLLVGMAPLNERAFFMSLNLMILRIGQTFGPLALGIVFGLGGLTAVFLSGVVIAAIMLLTVMVFLRGSQK